MKTFKQFQEGLASMALKTGLVVGGAAVVGTKMIASKLGQNSVTPVTPMNPVTPPSIEKEAQPGDGIPGRRPGESLIDYYNRRNKSTQQQIKNIP